VCVSRLSCLFVSSAEVELLLNAKVHVTSGPIRTRTRQEEHYSWPSLQKDCSPRESPSDVTSVRAAVAAATTTNNCYAWRRTAS
jgi:hypothetical protein